jgi:hypothetical protein
MAQHHNNQKINTQRSRHNTSGSQIYTDFQKKTRYTM